MAFWAAMPVSIQHALFVGQPITIELVIAGLLPEDARERVRCSSRIGVGDKRFAVHDCLSGSIPATPCRRS